MNDRVNYSGVVPSNLEFVVDLWHCILLLKAKDLLSAVLWNVTDQQQRMNTMEFSWFLTIRLDNIHDNHQKTPI